MLRLLQLLLRVLRMQRVLWMQRLLRLLRRLLRMLLWLCGGVRGAARTVDDLRLPRLGQDLVLRQPAVLDDTLGLA